MRGVLGSLVVFGLMAAGLMGGGMVMRDGLAAPGPAGSSAFSRAMDAAMARMHADMMLPPSGDPDRDFAAMMIPHHQGAIEMAKLELAHGKDPVLRRLAQGIIVEQGQEIAVMQGALAALPAAPPDPSGNPNDHHNHRRATGVGPIDALTETPR